MLSALLCWAAYLLPPPTSSDFDQIWIAARALASGADPYEVVPRVWFTGYPFYYPLTAAVVGLPFSALPLGWARVVWAAVSGTLLALAAMRWGRGLPAALLSASFLNALVQGQWSPLLTAAAVLPALAWVWAAKPSIGAALFVGFPSRRALIGALALAAIALAAFPSWPVRWVEALRTAEHVAPVSRPFGLLLLLALLRWRLPEARVMAALACVPQMTGLYETVPLFLIPRNRWEGYALAGSSYVAAFLQVRYAPRAPGMSLDAVFAQRWPFVLAFVWLPALAMLLWPRQRAIDAAP